MLSQAAIVALRILLFRAGPQDFPHSPQLAVSLPVLYASLFFALLVTEVSPVGAAVLSLANIGALALVTYWLLSARHLTNRFQQTFHALLATGIVLTLAAVPPATALAPVLKQIAANPGLLEQPGAVQIPAGPLLLLSVLNVWNLAVYAHIYRHAANTRFSVGLLIALSALIALMTASQILTPLVK